MTPVTQQLQGRAYANITLRAPLLFGCVDYEDRGILDRTHLRFYTRKTARRLLEQEGYAVIEEKMTVMPIELLLRPDPANPLMRMLNWILRLATPIMPGLLGYQITLN